MNTLENLIMNTLEMYIENNSKKISQPELDEIASEIIIKCNEKGYENEEDISDKELSEMINAYIESSCK